jgi:hypothetical protein
MKATINLYYKDGRWMTKRTFSGSEKEIKKHVKDTMAVYKNAGAASYDILDEDGKVIG